MKLSKIQRETLEKMRDGNIYTAYDLRVSMNTMYALRRRKLIKRTNHGDMTWLGWERTEFDFKITELGLQVLDIDSY